jgi:c-di-GMP-binding flagellar brake protein YcgR
MNGMAGVNKRKFERFAVHFPATISDTHNGNILNLHTRDISAGGAYFATPEPFEEGKEITIEIILKNQTMQRLTGHESCLKVTGTVVRSDQRGIAVKFDSHHIMPATVARDN